MAVGKEQTTSRLKMNIKSSSYLVHYRPYQVLKKGKQVASSTKLGLGDNVALPLMEWLTPTLANLTEICSALEKSLKKLYSIATAKSTRLLQPEHEFCQKNE